MAGLVPMRNRIQALRDDAVNERQTLVQRIELQRGQDAMLSSSEQAEFTHLSGVIDDFDVRIKDLDEEIRRSGRQDPETMALRQATSKLTVDGQQQRAGGPDAYSRAQAWAENTARELRTHLGGGSEGRAIVSGSVDVPTLALPQVVDIPWPARLIDLLTNRAQSTYALEYYQQTAKTNAAAPVADLATKPTSTFTVEAVQDRARVYAHLSQPLPLRIFWQIESIVSWLANEMAQGVYAAIEADTVSGNGSGEHVTGILNTTGTTAVPYTTDIPTTLRSAVTALQSLGEQPNGWALNPADAETIDLTRWGSSGGLLTGGFENDNRDGFGSSDNIFGPQSIKRVVSPSVPQGTAILADWRQLKLFLNTNTLIVANQFGDAEFSTNSLILRGEQIAFPAILRPQAFAICTLHS
jgi:HK97 family phage major capsid protein